MILHSDDTIVYFEGLIFLADSSSLRYRAKPKLLGRPTLSSFSQDHHDHLGIQPMPHKVNSLRKSRGVLLDLEFYDIDLLEHSFVETKRP